MDFRDVPRIPDQSSRRWPRTAAGRGQPMLDRKLSSLRSDRPKLYDEGANPLRAHRFEGRRLRSIRPNRDWFDLHADAARALAELRNEGQCERIGLVGEHGDTPDGGKQLADEFESLARSLNGRTRYAGDVSARPGEGRREMGPVATGWPAAAITIGMSLVACRAAWTAGVREATITSALRRTSSVAFCGRRVSLPSAERTSNWTFWPSIRPAAASA